VPSLSAFSAFLSANHVRQDPTSRRSHKLINYKNTWFVHKNAAPLMQVLREDEAKKAVLDAEGTRSVGMKNGQSHGRRLT